ncbi:MAG: Ig-like domain-containing protein [Cytophagaceae bacterium]
MKKHLFKIIFLFLCMLLIQQAYAQAPKSNLGKVQEVSRQLEVIALQKSTGQDFTLKLPSGKTLPGVVNYSTLENGKVSVIGTVKNKSLSSYSINISNNEVVGEIVLRKERKAYKYYSDPSGDVFIEEVDINDVLCVDYDDHSGHNHGNHENHNHSEFKKNDEYGVVQKNSAAVLSLQSLPSATGVIYLDADGEVVSGTRWLGGQTIVAAHPNLSDAVLREAWEVVAEDFRALNINVTTDRSVFNRAPRNRRMMVIITPTNTAAPGAGGVAYMNSFAWNDDTPCWTFITRNGKNIGEVSSHEAGHTLGLRHDGRTSPQEEYFAGHGNWAPIMGVGYHRSITQWSIGEYANASNTQNDMAVMSGATFGVGYRTDDHGNTNTSASDIVVASNGSVDATNNIGVIETRNDVDVFRFTTGGGSINLRVSPVARHSNLNVLVRVFNQQNQLVTTINPAGVSAAVWNASITPGTYFVHVTGTGEGNPLTNGYTDYASLGEYRISGTIPNQGVVNQPPVVSLTSPTHNSSFTAPANITITASASDPDGSVTLVEFFNGNTKIGERTASPWTINWTGIAAGTYTLTARATDNDGATTTSSPVTVNVDAPVCSVPSNLNATNITSSSATLNWNAVSGAQSFLLWYRIVGTSWNANNSMTVSNNSADLSALQANTEYEFTLRSNCSGQSSAYASPFVRFRTLAPIVRGPYGGNPWPIPGKIEAEDYDIGGQNLAYFDVVESNQGGAYRNDFVDIEATTDVGGGYNVGWIATGEWLEYTVNVNSAGRYKLDVRVASINTGRTFHILMDGENISGTLVVPNTGGWQNWQTITVNDVNLSAGQKIMRIVMGGDGFNINHVTFSPMPNIPPSVSITSPVNNVNFTAPANLTVSADAYDSDGSVTLVEFFNGNVKIGERTSAPYTISWDGVAAGTYTLSARATDNEGASANSEPVVVHITEPVCQTPLNLDAMDVSSNSAVLRWNDAEGAQNYLLFFRRVGDAWSTVNSRTVNTNHLFLTDLQPNTEYEFTVRSNCSNQNSSYSTPFVRFTTGSGCDVPSNLQSVATGSNSAELSWSEAYGAQSYNLWVRLVGASWSSNNSWTIERNSVRISGLQTGREYEFRVRSNCADQTSAFADPVTFSGTSAAVNAGAVAGANVLDDIETIHLSGENSDVFYVAPNPFEGAAEIHFSISKASDVQITVEDAMGNTIAIPMKSYMEAGTHSISLDIPHAKQGIYICRLHENGNVRFIKILKL